MTAKEVVLQGLGQAGKPYMQLVNVRWDSTYFRGGLRTTPTPLLLLVMGVVYIQWSTEPLLLTPILLYGAALTSSIKSRSGGNSFLMYKPGLEWFPIYTHLTQETPGLQIKGPHIMDYCTIWRKVETAIQRSLQLPPYYFHDDPRFRSAWMEGVASYEVDPAVPLSRRQRRKLFANRKRTWDCIADELVQAIDLGDMRDPALPAVELLTDTNVEAGHASEKEDETGGRFHEGLAESMVTVAHADDSELEQQMRWATALEPAVSEVDGYDDGTVGAVGQVTTAGETDVGESEGSPMHLDQAGMTVTGSLVHIEIEWAMTSAGQRYLVRKGEEVASTLLKDRPRGRITSRNREVLRSPTLQIMEAQCTFCRCGMFPPSITRCMRCGKHWMHTYCIPLELNGSHRSNFWCRGCRSLKACPRRVDEETCSICTCQVVDHESSIRCASCSNRWHVLCVAETYPKTLGGLRPSLFYRTRGPLDDWTCPACTTVEAPPVSMGTPDQLLITLPLDCSAGRIPVELERPFRLRLSGDHQPMQCYWHRGPLVRGSQTFREVIQLTRAIWGEHTDHVTDLEALLTANDVHVLALSTDAEMGSQLLHFVVFGQTKQKGPPIILLQGVQQVLGRRGLGTWALQFLYRACARSRELLAKGYLRAGYMDFLTTKGFIVRGGSVKLASVDDRYPTVGNYVCRRGQRLGELIGPTLQTVVSTYNESRSRWFF
jgi:hypothetical protein